MQNSRKYVICGAPSSGKSTVISELEKRGFMVIKDGARIIIDRGLSEGKTLEEIRGNSLEYQRSVTKLKLELEKKIPEGSTVFIDGGMPDAIAYYRFLNLDIEELLDICRNAKYDKIFFFERLDFKKDYARLENDEIAEKLSILIKQAYEEMGKKIIIVPKMSVEDRVKFILSRI
ncbi:MAG: ATP-binding protein [Candidatus Aenigmarchaeota archaeon]|nr:ATP-binding protein [Candidatus Aenigmarchaeota archaeon]